MDFEIIQWCIELGFVLVFALYTGWRVVMYKRAYIPNQAVVTEFAPPKGIDPIMCGVLLDGKLHSADITAGIITLVQKGVVMVTPIKDGNVSDYEISYLKDFSAETEESYYYDLLQLLFFKPVPGDTVRLSAITQNKSTRIRNFYIFRRLKENLYTKLVTLGYVESLSVDDLFKGTIVRLLAVLGIVSIIMILLEIAGMYMGANMNALEVHFMTLTVLFIVIFIEMTLRWRRLTQKGGVALKQIEGFRQYLVVAERERYASEGVLNSQVLALREYLAYAVAFNVVAQWNDIFADIRSLQDETGRF